MTLWMPGYQSRGALDAAAGGGLDAATTAWVSAVVSAGGAVSGTQQTRVNALIVGLKADGLFTILDRMWIFAGESDAKQATIDIIANGVATVQGTVTLNASGYLTNGGTGSYLSTTFNPSTAGGHFTQNSANIGGYVTTLRGVAIDGNLIIGFNSGGYDTLLAPLQSNGMTVYDLNGITYTSTAGTQAAGCWSVSRTVSTAISLYKNGSVVVSPADNSGALANVVISLLAANSSGSVGGGSLDRVGAIWFGGGLNATQAGNLSTRVNTYMTAWGINVY